MENELKGIDKDRKLSNFGKVDTSNAENVLAVMNKTFSYYGIFIGLQNDSQTAILYQPHIDKLEANTEFQHDKMQNWIVALDVGFSFLHNSP